MIEGTPWTPGPWNIHEMGIDGQARTVSEGGWEYDGRYIGKDKMIIGEALWDTAVDGGYPKVDSRDEMLANAHLIATAPELYEALEALTEIVADQLGGDFPEPLAAARAALAKARGEA